MIDVTRYDTSTAELYKASAEHARIAYGATPANPVEQGLAAAIAVNREEGMDDPKHDARMSAAYSRILQIESDPSKAKLDSHATVRMLLADTSLQRDAAALASMSGADRTAWMSGREVEDRSPHWARLGVEPSLLARATPEDLKSIAAGDLDHVGEATAARYETSMDALRQPARADVALETTLLQATGTIDARGASRIIASEKPWQEISKAIYGQAPITISQERPTTRPREDLGPTMAVARRTRRALETNGLTTPLRDVSDESRRLSAEAVRDGGNRSEEATALAIARHALKGMGANVEDARYPDRMQAVLAGAIETADRGGPWPTTRERTGAIALMAVYGSLVAERASSNRDATAWEDSLFDPAARVVRKGRRDIPKDLADLSGIRFIGSLRERDDMRLLAEGRLDAVSDRTGLSTLVDDGRYIAMNTHGRVHELVEEAHRSHIRNNVLVNLGKGPSTSEPAMGIPSRSAER